mmetsp:Transcript_3231/g.10693  ORF Transcript_3231/g.10693 Transcript_3231/m.10693 type:complete len:218 (+) Transcript_3231:72-725(+)
MSGPKLTYFPLAGRGELTRLVAAAGGVELEVAMPENWREFCSEKGMPEMLPVLDHGDLVLGQSGAIERYIASLSPTYSTLTPAQKAIDDMFCCTKEDSILSFGRLVFRAPETCPEEVPKVIDKLYAFLESRVPADGGYVNGLEFPTLADLVVFNMIRAMMPHNAAFKLAGAGVAESLEAKCPKMCKLADKVAQAPGVKEYLATSTSLLATPPGLTLP